MLPDINTLLKPRPKKYRNLVKHIQRDLVFGDGATTQLTEDELFNDLTSSRGTSRFLGVFSEKGIEIILNKFGFFNHLEHVGLHNPTIKLDTNDAFKHKIRVVHKLNDKIYLSCEIVMRRSTFRTPSLNGKKYPSADLIVVEWFLLQNPLKYFTRRRPQLPGQEFPGLGIASIIFELFYWLSKRLRADGVVLIPNYLHTGIFYGRRFVFINPKKQGVLAAMDNLLNTTTNLTQLSWACSEGQLIDINANDVFIWKPSPMILPTSKTAKEYIGSEVYLNNVKNTEEVTLLKVNKGYKKGFNTNWEAN
jgi:hypothetical protein